MSLDKKIKELRESFESDLKSDSSSDSKIFYEKLYSKYLSRKGQISLLFSDLANEDPSKRSSYGSLLNQLKSEIKREIDKLSLPDIDSQTIESEHDISIPGDPGFVGSLHPLTLVINSIKDIFTKLGFSVAYGPEVDTDFYNFEALNIPKHHPARDMQDTFYVDGNHVLRTHTSNSQIHYMMKNSPPISVIAPGRVYRNEDISVRSYCLFHQIEGLYIDKNVTFGDLKGVLNHFAKELFGNDVKTRFRPSYFPFTEPSAEMDVYWGLETESDKRITKGTGWLEILGCGMVDPEVFINVDYDPDIWKGFAFGLGIERIAMLLYGLSDIRSFYNGNIELLEQFKR